MSFVGLVDATIRHAKCRNAAESAIPNEFAEQTIRDSILRTRRFEIENRGHLTLVSIEGKKVHIVSIFLWPQPTLDAPVFAMEFVVFGPRPIIAVIDVVGLGGQVSEANATRILTQAHAKHVFQPGQDPPDWYVECRSGCDFFVRPSDLEEVARLETAHHDVFSETMKAWSTAPATSCPHSHQQRLVNYKQHHRTHTPGRPFLEKSMGGQWTERYLKEVFS